MFILFPLLTVSLCGTAFLGFLTVSTVKEQLWPEPDRQPPEKEILWDAEKRTWNLGGNNLYRLYSNYRDAFNNEYLEVELKDGKWHVRAVAVGTGWKRPIIVEGEQ